MSNNAITVFAVPELLENILLRLPPRRLLLVQRVNKTFRDHITSSIKMQVKLFFRPPPTATAAEASGNFVNPFLARILKRKFKCIAHYPLDSRSLDTVRVIDWANKHHLQRLPVSPYPDPEEANLCVEVDRGDFQFDEVSVDKGSSWREMLVAYEPITFELHWDSMYYGFYVNDDESCKLYRAAKMSHIVDKIAESRAALPPLTADGILQRDCYANAYADFLVESSNAEISDDEFHDDEDSSDKSAESASD